jgi:hypothetical protein
MLALILRFKDGHREAVDCQSGFDPEEIARDQSGIRGRLQLSG